MGRDRYKGWVRRLRVTKICQMHVSVSLFCIWKRMPMKEKNCSSAGEGKITSPGLNSRLSLGSGELLMRKPSTHSKWGAHWTHIAGEESQSWLFLNTCFFLELWNLHRCTCFYMYTYFYMRAYVSWPIIIVLRFPALKSNEENFQILMPRVLQGFCLGFWWNSLMFIFPSWILVQLPVGDMFNSMCIVLKVPFLLGLLASLWFQVTLAYY